MSKTTIEVEEKTRDMLRDARESHERNYDDTIVRLLGSQSGGQLWTEQEITDIVDRRIQEANQGRL